MALRRATLGLLVLAAGAVSLFLLPPDSDGAFSSFDGVMYGIDLERDPLPAISGHHPLFHLVAIPITAALRALGVALPGHVAVRMISAAGACACLLLVALAAGRARWAVGAAFALVLFSSRSFVIDAAVGESILPGCAAALWLLLEAARVPASPRRVAAALVLAVLLRQDNILLLPGVVIAVAAGLPRGARLRPLAGILIGAGAATLAGYSAAWWMATRGSKALWDYLFYLPGMGWTAPNPLDPRRFLMHLDALSAAVVGRNWPREDLHLLLGPAFVVALAAVALLLRGRTPRRALGAAVLVTLVVRAAFFSWFDAANPEWSVLTIALVATWGSRLADSEPRWPRPARVAGVLVLAGLAAFALASHARFTWRLRERHFVGAMARAAAECRGCRTIAYGYHAQQGLSFLGVPSKAYADNLPFETTLEDLERDLREHPEPTLVVMDRWVASDDPWLLANAAAGGRFLDSVPLPPGVRLLSHEGLAFAAIWTPPSAESRK
jgi:hypothetical protein